MSPERHSTSGSSDLPCPKLTSPQKREAANDLTYCSLVGCASHFVMINGLHPRKLGLTVCGAVLAATIADAASYTITIPSPKPAVTEGFNMGETRNPDSVSLTLDSRSLLLNGKRWTPVMGEFHFTRYPENEWREELLKMKAGGIDIV